MGRLLASIIVAGLMAGCSAALTAPSTALRPASAIPTESLAAVPTEVLATVPTDSLPATPTESVSPTLAQPTPGPTAASPTMPPFPRRPTLRLGNSQIEPSDESGCIGNVVLYLGEYRTSDLCASHSFVLDALSHPVSAGERLTFTTPPGWSFSAEFGGTTRAWTVTVGPIETLARLPEGRQESIPLSADGLELGHGSDSARSVTVDAPTEPGEYLLQLDGELFRDGWTWTKNVYFWRISVR